MGHRPRPARPTTHCAASPAIEAGDSNGTDAFDPAVEWDGFAINTFKRPRRTHRHHRRRCSSDRDLPRAQRATRRRSRRTPTSRSTSPSRSPSPPAGTRSPVPRAARTRPRSSGGPQSYTLDPDTDFALGDLHGDRRRREGHGQRHGRPAEHDGGEPVVQLHDDASRDRRSATVQGAAHISPLDGQAVKVEGIVTARRTAGGRGYWIQDPTPDANLATVGRSLRLPSSAPTAEIGDLVRVVADWSAEFRPAGDDPDNLTITRSTARTRTSRSCRPATRSRRRRCSASAGACRRPR